MQYLGIARVFFEPLVNGFQCKPLAEISINQLQAPIYWCGLNLTQERNNFLCRLFGASQQKLRSVNQHFCFLGAKFMGNFKGTQSLW